MQLLSNLLALPTGVILLLYVAPVAAEQQWPHNLPRHMKYFPEDEVHVKRGISVQERLQREKPIGIKKMSSDEGEMFFLDNWIFASDVPHHEKKAIHDESANLTAQAVSPLRPHLDPFLRLGAELFRRDFQCPTGTAPCTSLDAPNNCCATSDTCISIQDTGFGTVGCCPRGFNCAGTISCDTANGYSSCPDSPNGGCCLPGYSCQDVGCVVARTSVVTIQPSARPSSTAVVVVPSTSSAAPSSQAPASSSAYTCVGGWHTCPASLGGGCCQDGLACASGALCVASGSETPAPSVSSTASAVAPVRPTSNSAVTTSEEPSTTDPGPSVCPTGFYVCSAYYPSGCCRVGADCKTTGSCSPTASNTIVGSNGVTIVGPSGASLASQQGGSCPTGWYSCAASLGGDCCLEGFACGAQCTATSSGNTQVAGKVAPSTATSVSSTSIFFMISSALAIGVGMIIL
ncbi:hypothetical protein P154DRAFT_519009 [Amniculicola lignicola CBS 123094]|uniref:GPI anchored protein n=1 Tax=Amniculicola lignicola CBS 123094 TaxID=1392246 RepID=A0A6A5WTD6_9PLEO|nr:hypothetical protein P154DRAFT_519009 [Amniculicola lignicola CBS 123094]